MKIFILLPVLSFIAICKYPPVNFSSLFHSDTTIVRHLLDGNIAEWPEEKFTTDKGTKIRYAVDNDNQMLFLAINIADKNEQQRIIQKGMSLFVDVKGKKKENHGVEFPLGMENNSNIESMKVFGFSNVDPLPQSIKTEGTINIAIAWDSSFVLNIEYNVPLKMLDEKLSELNNKKINIGWKVKENEMTGNNAAQPVTSSSRLVAVPVTAGSRPPANRNPGSSQNNDPFPASITNKAQLFWMSHTIIF